MEHFYHNIQGWSDGIDPLYKKIVTELVQANQGIDPKPSYHFVEVGSWRGRSAACMAVEIANSGLDIKFDCVDTWVGMINKDDPSITDDSFYNEFLANMRPVEKYYRPVRLPSVEAAKLYADHSLDLVFIDALHDYDNVKADILAWRDKVKPGGILAGHDYSTDEASGVGRAVQELIPNFAQAPFGFCWWVQI